MTGVHNFDKLCGMKWWTFILISFLSFGSYVGLSGMSESCMKSGLSLQSTPLKLHCQHCDLDRNNTEAPEVQVQETDSGSRLCSDLVPVKSPAESILNELRLRVSLTSSAIAPPKSVLLFNCVLLI